MKRVAIFKYEWKHFTRNPLKIAALAFFILAGIFGLRNGAALYQAQINEIQGIQLEVDAKVNEVSQVYATEKERPMLNSRIDLTQPFWALRNSPNYHFKNPSPVQVYAIGQAEQYAYYKEISLWCSPYDNDMAEEIANPERLNSGTLDFSFIMICLLPLLLLILLYNIKGRESDQNIMPLIRIQAGDFKEWLFSRIAFYSGIVFLTLLGLMLYGAFLTNVFAEHGGQFVKLLLTLIFYTLIWVLLSSVIIYKGKSSVGNALMILGCWLLFVVVIPGAVHLSTSIHYPTNFMTDLIDVSREERTEPWSQEEGMVKENIFQLFPEVKDSPIASNEEKQEEALNRSRYALGNEIMKKAVLEIEDFNQQKNQYIIKSFWYNPISLFTNHINRICSSHYDDYREYRMEIQRFIDEKNRMLVKDIWNDVRVDHARYLEYVSMTNK